MPFVTGLKCRQCGERYPTSAVHLCETCFAPLEVSFDEQAIRKSVSRRSIETGAPSLWRYRALLPLELPPTVGVASGWTPLHRARGLEEAWGCREVWIKDDTLSSPSHSFKDRVVSVALNKALELGFTEVACGSRGNLGNSLAAHAAGAGLPCYVLVQADMDLSLLTAAQVCGARIVRVRGSHADVSRLCSEVAATGNWAVVNLNLRPFYVEGAKTFAFEIAEQLGWRVPDHVVVPVGGGTLLRGVWRGFRQLISVGLVDDSPCRIHAAQALGCSPIVRAVYEGSTVVRGVEPKTIALNIAVGNPQDGHSAVRAIRDSGGWAEAVSDDEILKAVQFLARTEGIWTGPAGAAAVAGTRRLLEGKRIRPQECVVIGVTGQGAVSSNALAGRLEEPSTISATLGDFRKLIQTEYELRDAWQRLSTA